VAICGRVLAELRPGLEQTGRAGEAREAMRRAAELAR